jgi:hypothetical protein
VLEIQMHYDPYHLVFVNWWGWEGQSAGISHTDAGTFYLWHQGSGFTNNLPFKACLTCFQMRGLTSAVGSR